MQKQNASQEQLKQNIMKKGKELQITDRYGEKEDVMEYIMKKGKELQMVDQCGEKEGLSQEKQLFSRTQTINPAPKQQKFQLMKLMLSKVYT